MKPLVTLLADKARSAVFLAGAATVGAVVAVGAVAPNLSPVDSESDVVATASAEPSESSEAPAEDGTETEAPAEDGAESEGTETDGTETEGTEPTAEPSACPEGLKNHGEYVSSVARDKSTTGREHGLAVSEAAHSDCGKTDAEEAEEGTEVEAEDSEDASSDDADSTERSGHEKKAKKAKKAKRHSAS